MTTVSLVRTTSLKVRFALTSASQPVGSTPFESRPLISAVVAALLAPIVASQVSFVSVITRVLPPATIWLSVADAVIVPVTTAVTGITSKVGVATIGFVPATAAAGTVTVIVSAAVMS